MNEHPSTLQKLTLVPETKGGFNAERLSRFVLDEFKKTSVH